MIEWGLCCIFRQEPVKFKRITAARLLNLPRKEQLRMLDKMVGDNAQNLRLAFETCIKLKINAFRINSELMALATHPILAYSLDDLEHADLIRKIFDDARKYAQEHQLRLSFHPDQFVILNSPNRTITENSLKELRHQAFLADLSGATEINLHAGGVYGEKKSALKRLKHEITSLPPEIKSRLTLENDDRSYTPEELLPVCHEMNIPFVYDVHHHRVNPDTLTIPDATEKAVQTWTKWNVTPHFHLSSPRVPWDVKGNHRSHADEIDPADFPDCWRNRNAVIDIEAKNKETAILKLRHFIENNERIPRKERRAQTNIRPGHS